MEVSKYLPSRWTTTERKVRVALTGTTSEPVRSERLVTKFCGKSFFKKILFYGRLLLTMSMNSPYSWLVTGNAGVALQFCEIDFFLRELDLRATIVRSMIFAVVGVMAVKLGCLSVPPFTGSGYASSVKELLKLQMAVFG